MLLRISVNIDVPSLADGTAFYCGAFGLTKKSEPYPGVVILEGAGMTFCLLEKAGGSKASPTTSDARRYDRHWTPVHVDFDVHDLRAALARVEAHGGRREQVFENPAHGSIAFCSDPFGHGFCLHERKPSTTA